MANELAITNGSALQPYDGNRLPAVQQLGAMLSKSGYFSDAREAAQAAVKVMAGEELGLAPVASMMGIHIIKGKVSLSANLMAAQVRRHGYNYRIARMDDKGCVIEFLGRDGKAIGQSSFVEEDAVRAEIKSDMYKKFPRNMYFSRAMSNGVKWFCPEVTSGLPIYTPEELGAAVNSEGEIDTLQIDTGGHPIGTQAAADYVAQQKLDTMKSNGGGKSNDFQMLQAFGNIKKEIGEEAYYRILGANGFEHANQIKDRSKGQDIFRELAAIRKSIQQKEQEQPAEVQG